MQCHAGGVGRWLLPILLLLTTLGCGRANASDLPPSTVFLYNPPANWIPWEPDGLIGTEPLHFVSGYRTPASELGMSTVQLQTMPTPRPFIPPTTQQEIHDFASTMQGGVGAQRWLELTASNIGGRPGIYSAAATSGGVDYRWIVFSRDKIFLLTLSLASGGDQATVPVALRQSIQMK